MFYMQSQFCKKDIKQGLHLQRYIDVMGNLDTCDEERRVIYGFV